MAAVLAVAQAEVEPVGVVQLREADLEPEVPQLAMVLTPQG